MFDEFVQLDNPQRDSSRGVGLGLPTARRLATLLGHGLTLRSVPGRGSCFSLRLPAQPPGALASAAGGTTGGVAIEHLLPMRGRVRVVVHDHAEARQTLQWQLQQWGLACDTADSITAALALTEHQRYEVLLRDRRLPAGTTGAAVARPDGLALLRCIQAQQPSLKLAAMVSGEVAVSSGQPETSDAVAWLAKPVRPMRLRTLLMHALDGADSPRPAGPAP